MGEEVTVVATTEAIMAVVIIMVVEGSTTGGEVDMDGGVAMAMGIAHMLRFPAPGLITARITGHRHRHTGADGHSLTTGLCRTVTGLFRGTMRDN